MSDLVNHPPHYNVHPSGLEAIEICRERSFNIGNVIKYCWRAGEKGSELEDLRKALWYLTDASKGLSVDEPKLSSRAQWLIARVVQASPKDSPLAVCLRMLFEPTGANWDMRAHEFRQWLGAHIEQLEKF
jgi:hypothetical protein